MRGYAFPRDEDFSDMQGIGRGDQLLIPVLVRVMRLFKGRCSRARRSLSRSDVAWHRPDTHEGCMDSSQPA